MVLRGEKQRGEQIERVTALLASRLNKAEAAEAIAFARNLYARVSADDLAAATPEDLAGGAISLWKFGAERKAATAKVRAFNPRAGEQGWHCGHTVVEIVNDDMPFLVDSVAAALGGMGLAIHALVHPIVAVVRDATGKRTAMPEGLGTPGAVAESVMHIEIDQTGDPHMLARIETTITAVLADVRVAVADWKPILAKLDECIAQLEKSPPPLPAEEVAEGRALLAWMRDNNFTFLGYRENEFGDAEGRAITPLADTGLGILRDPARRIMLLPGSEQSAADAAPEARQFLHQPQLLMLLKANARSTVHRAVPLDYIAVKRFDATGKVVGERRFVGLFTSAAYNRMPADIPYLRRKMRRVIERSGLAPSSHDGKALQNILDSYPRDELFQISEEELHRIASEIVALQERPRIRLFVRRDEFQRFVSCLIYAPRERFSTELRRKFEAILAAAFHGEVTGRTTQIGDDMLARILIIVATPPGQSVDTDVEAIEARLVRAARAWEDDLHDALRTERNGRDWQSLLEDTLRQFIAIDGPDDARAARTLRETLSRLLDSIERVAPGTIISLGTLRALLAQEFEEGTGASGHLRGGMRVCRLESGAVLPSHVVLMAGVSDALHPGGGGSIAWDLLEKHPVPIGDGTNAKAGRAEDPDARADALDTFREALCSAGHRLHISWTGVTLQKQEKRAPSVALSELRDLIATLVPASVREIVIEEPPHPFSLRLFTPRADGVAGWTSAAKGWAHAAKLMQAGIARPTFASEPLLADPSRVIGLEVLASAVNDPTRHFCERVAGLLMRTEADELAQSEPQGLKIRTATGVDNNFRQVAWRLESAQRRGDTRTQEEIETWLRHQPELPYGEEGRVAAEQIAAVWFPHLAAMREENWEEVRPLECVVGEYTITGRLDALTANARVVASLYKVEPYSAVRHWVTHLAMNLLATRGEPVPRITRIEDHKPWHFTAVENPEPLLASLCALYTEASQAPVPLFRKSGHEWLKRRKLAPRSEQIAEKDTEQAERSAQGKWAGKSFSGEVSHGEREEAHHLLCWPVLSLTDNRDLFDAFAANAERVLLPMMQHRVEGAPE